VAFVLTFLKRYFIADNLFIYNYDEMVALLP
jgi:hypothetical protein